VPGTQALWISINRALGREGRPQFTGWGMATNALTPWHDGGGDALARDFVRVNAEVIAAVQAGRMRLSQFNEVQDKPRRLQELMWRHYVVFWSARYAADATATPEKTLVECGVCDGLTAYFAINAVRGRAPLRAFLYDAWQAMQAEYLLESEQAAAGQYAFLSMENTQRNLEPFAPEAVFIKGFIPDSFSTAALPQHVTWLHIDLNASRPTTAALEMLYDRIPAGGVVLFDDYAWVGFYDTKVAVDTFFRDKRGALMPLPTGQAIFFKH